MNNEILFYKPAADKLHDIIDKQFIDVINEYDTEIYKQCKEAEEFNKSSISLKFKFQLLIKNIHKQYIMQIFKLQKSS